MPLPYSSALSKLSYKLKSADWIYQNLRPGGNPPGRNYIIGGGIFCSFRCASMP